MKDQGFQNILTSTSNELDLRNQAEVEKFFRDEKPDIVFLLAAKVGGILANSTLKASFIYDNLMIQSNVIHSSYKSNVKKLLFMGSACIYPKLATQPIKEEELLSGKLEESNFYLWKKGIPQYNLFQEEIEKSVNQFHSKNKGFHLIGNYYGGVSVSDCIKKADDLVTNNFSSII